GVLQLVLEHGDLAERHARVEHRQRELSAVRSAAVDAHAPLLEQEDRLTAVERRVDQLTLAELQGGRPLVKSRQVSVGKSLEELVFGKVGCDAQNRDPSYTGIYAG